MPGFFVYQAMRIAGRPLAAAAVLAAAASVVPPLAESQLAFDAVSIKPNRSGAAASDTTTTPGRLALVNVTPLSVILRDFVVLAPQVVGAPGWVRTERYDILASTGSDDPLSDRDRQPFLQTMLAERWGFRFHRETRPLRVYALVPVRGGPRLTPHTGPGVYGMKVEPGADRIVLRSTRGNMIRLTEILTGFTGSVVVNDTGLTGEYDFTLAWAQPGNPDATGPSLFTALQEQLGLRLAADRRAVQTIVIDHVDRPTED